MWWKKKEKETDIYRRSLDMEIRINELERMCMPDDVTSKQGEFDVKISLGRVITRKGETPLHVRIHELENQVEVLKTKCDE